MANLFPFEVHTPYRRFFSDAVEAIALTLIDGEAAVYANHSPFTAPVSACVLRIKDKDGKWKQAFTAEGILEVKDHKTVLVSDAAEWPEEIDYERAKAAKERAEKMLDQGGMKFETDNASSSLKRAAVRMKVWENGKQKG
jgi:F-type H+-transporting ATPase subunit epsilon